MRSDIIFSHMGVVGWIYVDDGILQKAFLLTKITNFRDRLQTIVVVVSGSCSSLTPVKVNNRHLFSDTFRFSSGDFHDLFPSFSVDDFLQKAHSSDPDTYPELPGDLQYDDYLMLSVSLFLPLTAGAIIKQGSITDEGIFELLVQHHSVAGEGDVLMTEDQIVAQPFLDGG